MSTLSFPLRPSHCHSGGGDGGGEQQFSLFVRRKKYGREKTAEFRSKEKFVLSSRRRIWPPELG